MKKPGTADIDDIRCRRGGGDTERESMKIVCTDLEGVLVPEIWINVAERTGIDDLRLTTRDISDYDVLMSKRLGILKHHGLKLKDITDVIATMTPLEGALDFLNWLRERSGTDPGIHAGDEGGDG